MNKTDRLITRLTNDLRELAADLGDRPVETSEDHWRELVVANQSLGRGIHIGRLDLASEFLGIYLEREQLVERLNNLRKSPQPAANLSEADDEFSGLATELLEDVSLARLLGAKLWNGSSVRGMADDYSNARDSEDDWEDSLADDLFNVTVEAQRELAVAKKVVECDGVGEQISVSEDFQAPVVEIPGLVLDAAKIQQDGMLKALDTNSLQALGRWFRAYRRATLNYTLPDSEEDSETPINNLFTLMKESDAFQLRWLGDLSNHPEYCELDDSTYGIWNILRDLFGQIGFDDLIDALNEGLLPLGPLAEGMINIIPSDEEGACKPVLLALSRGSGRPKGNPYAFENVMEGVKNRLVRCRDTVRLVVFITDTWDSAKFMSDHFKHLSEWRQTSSIRFLFLQVGAPRDQISQIAVDLT